VQIIQQEDVDASVERARRRANIRFDRSGGIHRREGPLDAEVDHRKHGGGLQTPVFVDLEIALLEVFDERALLIGHDRVNLDEVRFRAEGYRWLLVRGCLRWSLRGRRRRSLRRRLLGEDGSRKGTVACRQHREADTNDQDRQKQKTSCSSSHKTPRFRRVLRLV
jgi:hypothetical protein